MPPLLCCLIIGTPSTAGKPRGTLDLGHEIQATDGAAQHTVNGMPCRRRESNDFGWPTAGTLLQFRLWATVFPLSDGQHPVATPVALLTGAPRLRLLTNSLPDSLAKLCMSAH